MSIEAGEIYLADIGESVHRPVVVASINKFNRGRYAVVVPFTSANFETRSKEPSCVPVRAGEFGLTKDCVAQADVITLIESSRLDIANGALGTLDEVALRNLVRAIGHVIGAECEPA